MLLATPASAPRPSAPRPAAREVVAIYSLDPDPLQDLKDAVHERLVLLTEADPLTECVIYVGPWQRDGNGVIRVAGRQHTAHRVAAWVYLGGFELADRTVRVEHTERDCCPACINPEHLRVVHREYAAARKRAA